MKFIVYFSRMIFLLSFISIARVASNYKGDNKEVIFGACIAISFLSYFIWKRCKQIHHIEKSKNVDEKNLVLYLRSFKSDKRLEKSNVNRWSSYFLLMSLFPPAEESLEEQISNALEPVGNMFAIGKPGEKLPKLGAIRKQFEDNKWKGEVIRLLGKAKLVLLYGEATNGFKWELTNTFKYVTREKILFLIPGDKTNFFEFKVFFESVLPYNLPIPTRFNNEEIGGICFFYNGVLRLYDPIVKDGFMVRHKTAVLMRSFITNRMKISRSPKPAPKGKKILSLLIDLIILSILTGIIFLYSNIDNSLDLNYVFAILYSVVAFFCLYDSSLLERKTIGKAIVGIYVADISGIEASTGQCIMRLVLKVFPFGRDTLSKTSIFLI